MTIPLFVLASASPARRQLLNKAGISPVVYPSQFDESSIHRDDPAELVEQLALGKATVVAEQLRQHPDKLGDRALNLEQASAVLVLGCDSVLVVNGEVYGKPETPQVAISRWRQMRGGVGELLTGHVLIDLWRGNTQVRHQVTQVSFAEVSDRQISAYVATGEPLNCAGAFALEGRGGLLIERIAGCHSNVIGLSLPLLREMVETAGYAISEFWASSEIR
ncbi:MAG: Maf family protein [Elainellaceae cyanobacterium]